MSKVCDGGGCLVEREKRRRFDVSEFEGRTL